MKTYKMSMAETRMLQSDDKRIAESARLNVQREARRIAIEFDESTEVITFNGERVDIVYPSSIGS